MTMRRCSFPFAVFSAVLILLLSGCGHDPFSAPSRAKPVSVTTEVSTAKSIFFIAPTEPEGDILVWAYAAQSEANLKNVVFRLMGPAPGDPPGHQEEIVRRALADGASALIVVPGDSPELPKALAEAEAKKIPVVLLGKSIPAPAGSKPFTVVDHEPFETSAKKIVETTIEDLKKIGRVPEGTALVVADQTTDISSGRRVAALKAAASSAGFSPVVAVEVPKVERTKSQALVVEAVKSHPNVAIALGDDDESMLAAAHARIEFQGNPAYLVGGYIGHSTTTTNFPFMMESCQFDGKFQFLARLAVQTLLSRLEGKVVPEFITQAPIFTRGRAKPAEEGDSYTAMPEAGKRKPHVVPPPVSPTPAAESKPQ